MYCIYIYVKITSIFRSLKKNQIYLFWNSTLLISVTCLYVMSFKQLKLKTYRLEIISIVWVYCLHVLPFNVPIIEQQIIGIFIRIFMNKVIHHFLLPFKKELCNKWFTYYLFRELEEEKRAYMHVQFFVCLSQ